MSWSINVIGKPAAVAKAASAAMETNKCSIPEEEAYRLDALAYIVKAASQMVGDLIVQAMASGSMWKDGDTIKSHSLQMEIKPVYGYVVE